MLLEHIISSLGLNFSWCCSPMHAVGQSLDIFPPFSFSVQSRVEHSLFKSFVKLGSRHFEKAH